jgi:hypothetical protein
LEASCLQNRTELEAALASKVIKSRNNTLARKEVIIREQQELIAKLQADMASLKRKRPEDDKLDAPEVSQTDSPSYELHKELTHLVASGTVDRSSE